MTRLRLVAALAVIALATPALAVPAASSDPGLGRFTGVDGLIYEYSPSVLKGPAGEYFLGADVDFACAVGRRLKVALRNLSKLAKVISTSGRRVVFTLAPNKSAVLPAGLPRPLPHGECDEAGLVAQARLLKGFKSSDFLPLTPALTLSRHQVYWKTDQHWTTVGGAVFAQELASHLDPELGRQQRYTYGSETRLGAMSEVLSLAAPETLETAMPASRVRVRTAPGGPDWAGYPQFTFEHAWTSSPRRRTWPGRTLILGDSFGWYALQNLRPLFRHGHFVWNGHTGVDVPKEIRRSDTIVIEVLQLFAMSERTLSADFRKDVRRALR